MKIRILSTKIIGRTWLDAAAGQNIAIDELAFIETRAIQSAELEEQIAYLSSRPVTAIFTSANAVYAVRNYLRRVPRWQIFCISHKTRQVVAETFGNECIVATADTGQQLAEEILKQKPQDKPVFFCGNIRGNLLPDRLRQHGVPLREIVVYTTSEKPAVVQKTYDGIVFFSPSAVRSFFSANRLVNSPRLFAIGPTTASEIRKFALLPVFSPGHPSMEEIISLIQQQFQANNLK